MALSSSSPIMSSSEDAGVPELTVNTPDGEAVPLEAYNSHVEFFNNMQQLLVKKVRAGTESWLRYSKIKSDQLLTKSSIDISQYIFLQLIHTLVSRDAMFTKVLLEQSANAYSDRRPIINEWVRSNLKFPTDVMCRLVESVADPESFGLPKIPQGITEEILLITNKLDIFLEFCKKGDTKIVQWLLKTGINFDLGRPFEIAWQYEKWDTVKVLIHNGALRSVEVETKFKNTGKGTILHLAVAANSSEAISKLVQEGFPTDEMDAKGVTPLYTAIEGNNLEAATILLSNGAKVNLKTISGNTVLHAAASNGNLDAVKFLLNHNSSIQEKNNLGLTPLHIADQSGIFYIIRYLLHHNVTLPNVISSYPNLVPYMFFLGDHGVTVHKVDPKLMENYCKITQLMNKKTSQTPFEKDLKTKLLELVIKKKIVSLIQCLINLGGDLNVTNSNNETLLFYAVRSNSYDVVKLLLNEGIDANAKNLNGTTALHITAGNGMLDIVCLLMESGADIDAISNEGYTALHEAAKEGHITVVKHLLKENIGTDIISTSNDQIINETPLQLAASRGHLNIVKHFLDIGLFNDVKSNETWTTLHAAARAGQVNIVKLLLDQGFRANVVDEEGKTPLFWGAFGGNVPTVMTLLQQGADIHTKSNYKFMGNESSKVVKSAETPLHAAAWMGHKVVCKILIDKGINKNIRDAVKDTPLHNAARQGHYNATKFLTEIRAAKNAKNLNGTTALHAAAANSHLDIVDLLFDKGMDIDVPSDHNETPLYSAAQSGHLDVVKHLLDKLAEVNAANIYGQTPLTAAVMGGHYEVALYLLDKGANVDAIDSKGNTLIMEAVSQGYEDIAKLLIDQGASLFGDSKRQDGFFVLHIAVKGSPRIVQLLLESKVSIEFIAADGSTPLFEAVRRGNEDVVKVLFDYGYPLDTNNTRKDDNMSCLHMAVVNNSLKIAELLLNNKAYINPLDKNGDTPLHLAIKKGSYDIARMLLDRGADIDIKNTRGQTPLQVAKENNRKQILNLRLCDCETTS